MDIVVSYLYVVESCRSDHVCWLVFGCRMDLSVSDVDFFSHSDVVNVLLFPSICVSLTCMCFVESNRTDHVC